MTPRPAWLVPIPAFATAMLTIAVVVALLERPLAVPTAIAAVTTSLLLGIELERRRGT